MIIQHSGLHQKRAIDRLVPSDTNWSPAPPTTKVVCSIVFLVPPGSSIGADAYTTVVKMLLNQTFTHWLQLYCERECHT